MPNQDSNEKRDDPEKTVDLGRSDDPDFSRKLTSALTQNDFIGPDGKLRKNVRIEIVPADRPTVRTWDKD